MTVLLLAPAGAEIRASGTATKGLDIRYAFVDAAVAPQYRDDFTLHVHDGIVSRQNDAGVVSVTVPARLLRRLTKAAPSLPNGTFDAPRGCVGGTTRRLRVRQDGRTLAKAVVHRCGSANQAENARLERYVAPLLELTDPSTRAADIPVAHTPPGGYGATFPTPVPAGESGPPDA